MPKPTATSTYPLPGFLEGRCAPADYWKWLHNKADTLLKRDKKRGKAYAAGASTSLYKKKIHEAVEKCGRLDPFTGETLAWELIGTWDTSHAHDDEPGYKKRFALMPTVDHIDPDLFEFEICSWRTNDCKSDLNPSEFVFFCKRIAKFRGSGAYIRKWLRLKSGGA
jgi:hypothetical protein